MVPQSSSLPLFCHGWEQELNFDYCPQFGENHLVALVPLAPTLERLSLRGCNLDDYNFCSFLDMMATQNEGYTRLQMLDLSAVDREGSLQIGDLSMIQIAVRGLGTKRWEFLLLLNSPYQSHALLSPSFIDPLSRIEMSATGVVQEHH